MNGFSRRFALQSIGAALPALALTRPAMAAATIGSTTDLVGSGKLVSGGRQSPLRIGSPLFEGDMVRTGKETLAELMLNTETRINMGPETEITVATYLAEMGGTITVGGAIVFDRPEDQPKVDLTFQTEFGEIGVRGTRFFFGPSKGKISVFVQRGSVTVSNAGVTRRLKGGDGTDLEAGQPPTEVAKWKEPRIKAAFELVGLAP
ncbi:MAG: FecR domain-containing protein [Tabrizicola sp.]